MRDAGPPGALDLALDAVAAAVVQLVAAVALWRTPAHSSPHRYPPPPSIYSPTWIDDLHPLPCGRIEWSACELLLEAAR